MKRNILIIIICVILSIFLNIPEYRELNDLVIVDSIGLDCEKNTIYLKEIIPEKDDNGIEYKYKYYKFNDIDKIKSNKFYLNNSKYIITNCHNTKDFLNTYNIKYKYIYHTQEDIKKELSKRT